MPAHTKLGYGEDQRMRAVMKAWLLERTANGGVQYLGALNERLAWVTMADYSIRFARKEDAITLLGVLNGPVFDSARALNGTEEAVEHVWADDRRLYA